MKQKIQTVDEYMSTLPVEHFTLLESVRNIIKSTAPEAHECISYGIPAYKLNGMLIGFAGFKNHCSLFLFNNTSVNRLKDWLTDFKISMGTIQFTAQKSISVELLKKIILSRVAENEGRVNY
jgi:uncharacterized protein YdhG (YjbR/CyaY superfamily)